MIPLLLAKSGEVNIIKKIAGNENSKKFLESLGFIPGANITIICENFGNVIVAIKDSRIALSREMAQKIMI